MSSRMFQRSLQSPRLISTSLSCSVCMCQCGRRLLDSVVAIRAARTGRPYATRRAAPATRRREIAANSRVKDPQYFAEQEAWKKQVRDSLPALLGFLHRHKFISATREEAVKFCHAFQKSIEKARGEPTVDVQSLKSAQTAFNITDEDCLVIAQAANAWLIREVYATFWTYLFKTLSKAQYVPATLWVMGSVYESARGQKSSILVRDTLYSYEHLRMIASDENGDYRAKTLLGRIEMLLGNEDAAVALWTQATHAVETGQHKQPKSVRRRLAGYEDHFQLESPYIELATIHIRRWRRAQKGSDVRQSQRELEACRKALETGCRQDDPWSYYQKALLSEDYDSDGNHLANSTWLYHMTKAAASGHAQAMFAIGKYYAESGWKYIEDEPPDSAKPTPFDSYPASEEPTLSRHIAQFFGLRPILPASAEDDIFRTAALPSTAKHRFKLATHWCLLAAKKGYAPAAIYLARISLEKKLWSGANAPSSALQLQDDRYTYESRAKFDAKQPKQKPPAGGDNSEITDSKSNEQYDTDMAEDCLRLFFYAHQTYLRRKETLEDIANADRRAGRRAPDSYELGMLEEEAFAKAPPVVRHFWLNAEVRESYEHQIEQLLAEAQQLCDEHGFTIYAQDNSLMYRHKPRRMAGGGSASGGSRTAVVAS